jgi:hypothetical protein
MTISSLSSLASTAFDTARATFKGLAEAAVGDEAGTPGTPARAAAVEAAPTQAEVRAEARAVVRTVRAADAGVSRKGVRQGTKLDAYA